jgi:hypothetical protein
MDDANDPDDTGDLDGSLNRPSRPEEPDDLSVDFHRDGDALVISRSGGSRGVGCFLLVWQTGWTIGCVALLGMVISDPSLGTVAFAIPFWAAWLAVGSVLVWNYFGKEVFHLSPLGAGYSRHALVNLSRREVPLEEIRGFGSHSSDISSDSATPHIEMRTLGEPLRFCGNLGAAERSWLIAQLREHLARLTGGPEPATERQTERQTTRLREADTGGEPAAKPKTRRKGARAVALAADDLAERPSDCRWQSDDDFQSIGFTARGRFSVGAFFGLLFINAFWNGIVSVFVLVLFGLMPGGDNAAPQGTEWWLMFLFLIPFEVVGLVMFSALASAAVSPFVRTTWRFDRYAIVRRRGCFGLRGTRTWEVDRLSRIELRRKKKGEAMPVSEIGTNRDTAGFKLAFFGPGKKVLCTIEDLTEGEARWIGGIVLRNRPSWFHS